MKIADMDTGGRIMCQVEQALSLVVRPKPRWLPYRVWKWVLGRLIYLEIKSPIVRWE